MNTIIEKIRAEVERLINECDGSVSQYGFGKMSACNRILNFLDTLQEQPVKIDIRKELESIEFMGVNDARDSETIARHFYELGCRRTAEKYDEIEYKRQRAEESVPKDLEEAADEYEKKHTYQRYDGGGLTPEYDATLAESFIAGAEWDAEHRDSSEILKDLESYAQTVEDYYDVGEERGYLCTHRGDIKNAVLAGAKWQKEQDEKELSEKIASAYQLGLADKEKQTMDEWLKDRDGCFWDGVEEGKKAMREQMMKEAVEGEILLTPYPTICLDDCKDYDFNEGDKVRIIIVKEEKNGTE